MTVNSEGKIYTVKGLLPMVNVGDLNTYHQEFKKGFGEKTAQRIVEAFRKRCTRGNI